MVNETKHRAVIGNDRVILDEMYQFVGKNLLDKWYPLVVDTRNGGFYTDISYDWKVEPVQHKMIVTQSRFVWTASKAAVMFGNKTYADAARHGFEFLKNSMWDQKNGGFYQMRDGEGKVCDYLGFFDEKRTYGNAFAIYALAALYELTHDRKVLDFARKGFKWVEEHAFDPKQKGYFQFISADGKPFNGSSPYKTRAYDDVELDYKDQNSSIHLLEAYTELYNVWPDPVLKKKLSALLRLIRDVITTKKGYMNLFFHYDWTPLSFRNAPKEVREKNYRLDHVSFGHDYETGFLLLEASHALGMRNDTETLRTARKMVDHAIANGWDSENGGFFDAGYYFKGDKKCTIIQTTKNWWAQAEALNVLLIMSRIFPKSKVYPEYFNRQWSYVKQYLIDSEYGDWFEGGLDKEPHFKTGPKGHIWKANYHTGRAMMNCVKMLAGEDFELVRRSEGFRKAKEEFDKFIAHWQRTAEKLGR
jgi:cellobiose epimerase